ncbi:MAG: ATP-binding cassette domain-containing protein [Thaumarchaeota archaeon]|nr:MAG: ATP-binding cassette domain-containing protein [Nitrososphaerota archaeon]
MEELELIPGLSRSAFGGATTTATVTQLTHVSKVFLEPKRREVFTDVNMRVKRGEFVALAGPVGSGKTTLVNLLAGIERASSGSIQVLGKETTRLSGRELTTLRLASLGLVPQVQNLMQEFTVSQNVELPLFFLGEGERESRLSRVREVLVLMGINADAERKVADLSVGEKQLVSIARAMVKDPPLLVMDEPTESLDPLVSEVILEMLRGDNALRAKTLIIATHDKRIIELATRTVRMNAKIHA